MLALIDTNVLGRLANTADQFHAIVKRSLVRVHQLGMTPCISAQVMIEFRAIATRPVSANGLGKDPATAALVAAGFESQFRLVPDDDRIYPAWKLIVDGLGIIGKQVHDARIVATCHVHSVTNLLTFNLTHFSRMATFGPGITVLDPATV